MTIVAAHSASAGASPERRPDRADNQSNVAVVARFNGVKSRPGQMYRRRINHNRVVKLADVGTNFSNLRRYTNTKGAMMTNTQEIINRLLAVNVKLYGNPAIPDWAQPTYDERKTLEKERRRLLAALQNAKRKDDRDQLNLWPTTE